MSDPLSKTRAVIKSEVDVRCGAALGTDGGGNPITIDTDVTEVTASICRRTDCFFWGGTAGPGAYGTDIINGQIDYCAPPLYRIVAVEARDQAGNSWPLTPRTQREFDAYTADYWRAVQTGTTANVNSNPLYLYLKGENSFGIWPVPTYTSFIANYTDLVIQSDGTLTSVIRPFTSGDIGRALTINGGAGFTTGRYIVLLVDSNGHATVSGNAGTVASTGGTASFGSGGIAISGFGTPPAWSNESDVCPLQPKNHMAVVWGVCVERLLFGMASRDDVTRNIATRLFPIYEQRFKDAVGMIEAEVVTQAQHSEPGLRSLY